MELPLAPVRGSGTRGYQDLALELSSLKCLSDTPYHHTFFRPFPASLSPFVQWKVGEMLGWEFQRISHKDQNSKLVSFVSRGILYPLDISQHF